METQFPLVLASEIFSSYKNHVTLKVLIGCSPYGSCSFVRHLYTRSISDVAIVKQSGFLGLEFDEGGSVMADREFVIADCLPNWVSSNIPAFLFGRISLIKRRLLNSRLLSKIGYTLKVLLIL